MTMSSTTRATSWQAVVAKRPSHGSRKHAHRPCAEINGGKDVHTLDRNKTYDKDDHNVCMGWTSVQNLSTVPHAYYAHVSWLSCVEVSQMEMCV